MAAREVYLPEPDLTAWATHGRVELVAGQGGLGEGILTMNNGRNRKGKPASGFQRAALVLTTGLSEEAADNLTEMVRDVAKQYGYNDSLMTKRLKTRLNKVARNKENGWAREVLDRMGGATA
jgi:hypothetical protein